MNISPSKKRINCQAKSGYFAKSNADILPSLRKVSVVVPNYNYKKYLWRRVKSILRQTYPIYELIILDDASTDGSAEEIRKIVEWVRRKKPELSVKFVENTKNTGKAIYQWEKGFELAQGDFVWIAEADDAANKHFLKEVMPAFDDPEVAISYAESKIMNGAGVVIAPNFRWSRDKEKTGHFKQSYVKNGADEIREIMAVRCTIPNVSAVVWRKAAVPLSLLEQAAEFSQVGDWWLYAQVLSHGKIAYNHKARNIFRVHGGSVTSGAKGGEQHYKEIREMQEYFKQNYNLSERVKTAMRGELERVRKGIL